jgi:aspartate racemase
MTTITMPTIGLLGGMSTEATAEYYRLINGGVRSALGGLHTADLLIASVNFQVIASAIQSGNWDQAAKFLAERAYLLQQGGADYLFMATNTMHRVRDAIKAAIAIPFVDILEVTADALRARGVTTAALAGTRVTMCDPFFTQAYRAMGIEILVPASPELEEIDRIIFQELCCHRFLPESRQTLVNSLKGLIHRGAQGVILGCTELSLLIDDQALPGVPIFDSTKLHCQRAVTVCLGNSSGHP